MMRRLLLAIALFLCASSARAIPTLVQAVNCSNAQNAQSYTAYTCSFDNPTLSGNIIVVGMNLSGGGTVTVSDDKSQSYTIDKTLSGGQIATIARFANTASGAKKITISFSAAATFVQANMAEWSGVATSTPVDVSCSAQASSTSVTCGSMTTTVDGDLICQYGVQDTNGATTTTWSSPSLTPIAYDSHDPQFLQCGVQGTHGAINPSVTMSPTNHHTSVGVAYKAAVAGTNPSAGIRIVSDHHFALNPSNGYTVGTTTVQFPCTGNLIVLQFIVEPNVSVDHTTTITDTQSNTYTFTGAELNGGAGGGGNLSEAYATNASCSTGDSITFKTTGTQVSGSTVHILDVTGAATSAFDSTTGRITATNTQSSAGSLTAGSISPSTSNGLVVTQLGVQSNTVSGVSPGSFTSTIPTPDASPNPADQNNGWSVNYNANTSSESYVWTQTGGAFQQWAWTAIAFKAPAIGSTPTISKISKLSRIDE